MCLFALKSVNINVSRSAAPKLALGPESCFNSMKSSQTLISMPSLIRIERDSDGGQ